MSGLNEAIQEISGDPGIGLKLGSEERPEYYSPIAVSRTQNSRRLSLLPCRGNEKQQFLKAKKDP